MTVSEILRDASQLDVAVHRSVTESKLARKDPKTSSTGTKSTFNFPHILEVMFYQYQPHVGSLNMSNGNGNIYNVPRLMPAPRHSIVHANQYQRYPSEKERKIQIPMLSLGVGTFARLNERFHAIRMHSRMTVQLPRYGRCQQSWSLTNDFVETLVRFLGQAKILSFDGYLRDLSEQGIVGCQQRISCHAPGLRSPTICLRVDMGVQLNCLLHAIIVSLLNVNAIYLIPSVF